LTTKPHETSDVDVRFDHTIILARDKQQSAEFFADPFGHYLEALTARYDGSALT
jgi:hypothetical protein